MERERFLTNNMNWNYSNFGVEIQSNDLNNNNSCIFNPNWDNSMDQSDPFESALSSIVSSPAASNGGGGPTTTTAITSTTPITGDNIMIRELIGRLGSICNSGEISPQPYIPGNNSTNTSCYNTPLNSPPKLNLSMMDPQMRPSLPLSGTHLAPFPADPGFAERAARFSCFGTRNVGQFGLVETELGCYNNRSMPKSESGKLSRVSSNQSFRFANGTGSQMGNSESNAKGEENGVELNDSREGSSVSEQVTFGELNIKTEPVPPAAACNNRKRKTITKGKKGKEAATNPKDVKAGVESDELKAKRSKHEEANGTGKGSEKGEECCDGENKNGGEGNNNQKTCNNKDNLKPPEPPKDYIHVRARRGQATDSHSLAERVRREKISERMKFLQDLVPGCNKVIGKAVMLDEIINYVQSLQRQVEFLSMKLATVNPRMDFNMEALLPKEVFQPRGSLPQTIYPLDSSIPGFSNYPALQLPSPQLHNNGTSTGNENQFPGNPAMSDTLRQNLSMHGPPAIDGFSEAVPPQVSSFWEDDLQSVVQMGYGPN